MKLFLLPLAPLIAVLAIRSEDDNWNLDTPNEADSDVIWDVKLGGAKEASCGDGMHVKHVYAPWRTMKSRVNGAKSKDDCKRCGLDLQRRNILHGDWKCRWRLHRWGYMIIRHREKKSYRAQKTSSIVLKEDGYGPIRVAGSELPEALRGIFWLHDQGKRSALMSFAGNGPHGTGGVDCKWCSTGKIVGNTMRMRATGSDIWAMASDKNRLSHGVFLTYFLDLFYNWIFDDPVNPTSARILPVINRLPFGERLSRQGWFINFAMELRSPEKAEEMGFKGSVVWDRITKLFGRDTSGYDLVQVVDENGAKIEPAWSKFVEYQMSEAAGPSPGTIFFRTENPDWK